MQEGDVRHRLLAILAADAAGYSRLMTGDDFATLRSLDAAREVFRTHIEAHEGRVIDMAGDSVLASFETVGGAVNASRAIQEVLCAQGEEVPESSRLQFRIGIHLGDVLEKSDGTVYGDGVNIAARLQALAEPGGITVSHAVRDAVFNRVGAAFEDLGEQTVKNIERPVLAFRMRWERMAAAAALSPRTNAGRVDASRMSFHRNKVASQGLLAVWLQAIRRRWWLAAVVAVAGVGVVLGGLAGFWNAYHAARASMQSASLLAIVGNGDAGPLSIIVLPFANLTGDPQQAYVADGLTAAVTADLSRIRDAFIVSTATAFAYRDKAITVHQIGQELGVRFALQGGVQRTGDKVRITAQLSDTTSNRQIWSESFDGSQADLFALQELVTTRIGNSIGREVLIVAARDGELRKSDPKAADLILRASAIYSTKPMTHKTLEERQALYRQALLLDPSNVQAMVGLAVALANSAGNGFVSDPLAKEKQLVESRDLAVKAMEHVPRDAQIHSVLSTFAQHHGDYLGAVRGDETALSLDPKTPFRYSNLADHYNYAGQPTRAIELLKQGIQLDPRSLQETVLTNMGRALLILGEDDSAIQWLSRAVEANPAFSNTHAYLAVAYARKGNVVRAQEAAAAAMRVDPMFRLANLEPPLAGYPGNYREFWETKLIPAGRLAGLPE